MRRRLFSRRVANCAVVSGVSGIAANLLLAGFFAAARPWAMSSSPWAWLGPANDVTGAISMATLIPVVVALGRALPANRLLRVLSAASAAGMGALAVVAPLMLSGVVSLTAQFVVAGVALPVIFGWLVVVNRVGDRAGVLPGRIAAFGRTLGCAALVATVLAGAGSLLPSGTVRSVVLGLAAVIGLPAYLAFPVWPILLAGKSAGADPIAPISARQPSGTPGRSSR